MEGDQNCLSRGEKVHGGRLEPSVGGARDRAKGDRSHQLRGGVVTRREIGFDSQRVGGHMEGDRSHRPGARGSCKGRSELVAGGRGHHVEEGRLEPTARGRGGHAKGDRS